MAAKIEVRGEVTYLVEMVWGEEFAVPVRPITRHEAFAGINTRLVNQRMVAKNR